MGEPQKVSTPVYTESVPRVNIEQLDLGVQAHVTGDGRIAIDLERRSSIFSPSLRNEIQDQINNAKAESSRYPPPAYEGQSGDGSPLTEQVPVPRPAPSASTLSYTFSAPVVMSNVHSPWTSSEIHPRTPCPYCYPSCLQRFRRETWFGVFQYWWRPRELMAYMVRSPGLLPSLDVLRGGVVARHREMIAKMMEGCWRACIEEGDGMDDVEERGSKATPFVADLIIANPPSFAHVHCGQKLGIPVHLMFTMPWTATQAFPHPLANIKAPNRDIGLINYVSYAVADTLLWQGLGSVQNRFREKVLGLEPIRLAFGPRMLNRLKVPHTYCWSPSLIPKPRDWGSHISVAGFYFLAQTTEYSPEPALAAFLSAGPPPIYVGFGSIIIDDPKTLTNTIFEAIRLAGVRAVVSKGWAGLGSGELSDEIFLLGDVPHDWLFRHVSAVIHHGGAGTTAAAMAAGKPSVIVPFFGDQFFWGAMVQKAGVGAKPIPGKELTASFLATAIIQVLQPAVLDRAEALGKLIAAENGIDAGCASLHQQTEVQYLKCSMAPHRVAVWKVKKRDTCLSAFSATALLNAGLLRVQDLKLIRHVEYDLESGPWDPISGVVSSCLGMVGDMTKSFGDVSSAVKQANKANPADGSVARGSLNVAQGTFVGASKGVGRIILAGFRSPFEVMLSAARGFHNVPTLYGDESVRPPERITGVISGFEAMGKEIGYSLYDGISGLLLHPIDGARWEGFAGFSKGVAKGLGGFVLKPIAAAWGIGGYTYEGINKELERLFGSSIKAHISLGRLAQGSKEFNNASNTEIAKVIRAWEEHVCNSGRSK